MTKDLSLQSMQDNARLSLAAQMTGEKTVLLNISSATEVKEDSSVAVSKKDVSTDVNARRISAQDLSDLPFDASNAGSNFIFCPTASIPSDISVNADAVSQKIDALAQYAQQFPSEPQGIQNLLLLASNLSNAALLSTEMKKELIQKISIATNNSVQKASEKYQGLRGEKGSNQFIADVTAPFKLVGTTLSSTEVVHQTLRAVSGKLLMVDSNENHPSASEMVAQNIQLAQSLGHSTSNNGVSSPNALGNSKKSAPVTKNVSSSNPPPHGTIPAPILPDSGAPKLPSDFSAAGSVGLKGVKDYYSQLLQYIHAHPGDITAMQYMMAFLTKISQDYQGNIPADVTAILDGGPSGQSGALNAISSFIPRLAEYGFFTGFGSSANNGQKGMQAYVDAMIAAVDYTPENKYTSAMRQELDKVSAGIPGFAENHTDASGRLFIQQSLPNPLIGTPYNMTYYWDGKDANGKDLPDASMPSQEYILTIVNNQSSDGTAGPDPFNVGLDKDMSTIDGTYRVSALSDLLAQYKDPLTAITLWIMQVYDTKYQTDEGGLNETTDDLTSMTNDIATRLSTLAQNIGFSGYTSDGKPSGPKMTPEEAQEFADTLANGSTMMDSLYQLNGISSTWDKNVFQDICGIALTNPKDTNVVAFPVEHFPSTVGQLLFGNAPDTGKPYSKEEKALYLCTMNLAPPINPAGGTPSISPPSVNEGFQATIGDLQQAGSLITGRSKVVSLQLQQTSDCDSQDIKAWSTMLQDLAQFILKGPIAAQKTN